MKEYKVLLICLFTTSLVSAQRVHVGVFGGLSAYNGDLTEKIFPKKVTNGAIGVTINYELRDRIMLRGGFTYSVVGGADRFSDGPTNLERNLSFETQIIEFSAVGEYYLLNLNERRYSPYMFAGLAIYQFNPYAYDASGTKIFLKPLSTEGQGLPGYASRRPYGLTQAAIPFGGGIKINITEKLRLGIEVGFRKLFTDYLDDVSTAYVDPNDLLAAKGQLAVDMSYRGDEVAGNNPAYPVKGYQRGGQEQKDWYYFSGIHLTYKLGSGQRGGGLFGGGKNKRSYGCPVVPQ
jgi:Domain of unknown function (DUF6089)